MNIITPVHFFEFGSADPDGNFLPNLNILWQLKSKIKHYFDETVFYTCLYNEKIWITRVLFVDKGSGSWWPKKTGSGSATLNITIINSYQNGKLNPNANLNLINPQQCVETNYLVNHINEAQNVKLKLLSYLYWLQLQDI